MKLHKNILAAILAGLLALGAVACETEGGEDPLVDDPAGTEDPAATEDPMASPTPTG